MPEYANSKLFQNSKSFSGYSKSFDNFLHNDEIFNIAIFLDDGNVFLPEMEMIENILIINETQHSTSKPYVLNRSLGRTVALDEIGRIFGKHVCMQIQYQVIGYSVILSATGNRRE